MISDYKDTLSELLSRNDVNGKHVYGVLDMGYASDQDYVLYKYLTESYKFEVRAREFLLESFNFMSSLRDRLSDELGVEVRFKRVYANLMSEVFGSDVSLEVLLGAYLLSMRLMLVLYNFLVDIQADDLSLIDEVFYVGS